MHALLPSCRQNKSGRACLLLTGIFVLGLVSAEPVTAGMGAGGSGAGAGTGAGSAASAGAGAGDGGAVHRLNNQSDLRTCLTGIVWDAKRQKCLAKHGSVLADPDGAKY
jgi:hypothetical protein